jgi:hypothetical protein
MENVYILFHSYDNNDCEETKTIGVYNTEETALLVIEEYKKLPGFMNYPNDFHISKYKLNENNWTSGFIKWKDMK